MSPSTHERVGDGSGGGRRRWWSALAVVLLGITACGPTTSRSQATMVFGDSITWQAKRSGAFDGLDWDVVSFMGFQAESAVTQVGLWLEDGPIDRLVVLLGTNDAGDEEGWTEANQDTWSELFGLVPESTCIVVVKPYVTEAADEIHREKFPDNSYLANIAEVNRWIDQAESRWPNLRIVDWEPYARQPNVLAEDGVHLRSLDDGDPQAAPSRATMDAAAARLEVIEAGLDRC